jgi:thiol-disulfide isomerase/thioredoxin
MSGLLFLSIDDFKILKGTKGNILCHSIEGFSLILFYSTQCPHCQKLIPIFKKLPGSIGGCQFGMINISTSQNKKLIKISKETIAPIEYVPHIILFVNGKPFMRYQGPPDGDTIRKFVLEIAQKVNNKQKFSNETVKEDPRVGIPLYTIGHPLYGHDNVTYLLMEEAYPEGGSSKYIIKKK